MRRLLSCFGCLLLLGCCGCAMCDSSRDSQYAAYGGRRQRADMVHGRVGSVFDPAAEISQPSPAEQSPAPALPPQRREEAGAATPPSTAPSAPSMPSVPGLPESPPAELPPSTLPEPGVLEPGRFPEQTPGDEIDVPEIESPELPAPGELPSPGTLPPDLPDNRPRSATTDRLRELFDAKF